MSTIETVLPNKARSESPLATILAFPTQERPQVRVKAGEHGRWTPILETVEGFAVAGKQHAKRSAKVSAFHTARSPLYYGRVAMYAPHGTWRLVRGAWRWFSDSDGRVAFRRTLDTSDESAIRSREQHRQTIKERAVVSLIGASVVGGLGLWGWCAMPDALHPATLWSVYGSAPLALGFLGRPAGERVAIDRADLPPALRRVRSDDIHEALCAIGIARLNRAVQQNEKALRVLVGYDAKSDSYRAQVTLPGGVTATEVIARHESLASALHRSPGMVITAPHPNKRANCLTITVTNMEPEARQQGAWPLATAEVIDVFEPFPFGEDATGNVVTLSLDETNVLIGSLPGAGKTSSIKAAIAPAILDPRTELVIYELKGTGDLRQFEPVCTRYAHGRDDETMRSALIALRALDAECALRAKQISNLPFDVCPDSKVTSAVADEIEGLHPLVMVIDEVHNLTLHPEFGPEASTLMSSIVKVGRALGVKLIVATQRPSAESLPSEVRSQFGTRFCLRVKEQPENDMILGTGSYSSGSDATKISPAARGTGILDGQYHHDAAQTFRVYFLDAKQVQKVVDRALFLRGGRVDKVTCPGEGSKQAERNILTDILSVSREGEKPGLWFDTIIERLRDLDPNTYDDTFDRPALRREVEWASRTVAGEGPTVPVKGIYIDGANRDGYRFDDIRKCLSS